MIGCDLNVCFNITEKNSQFPTLTYAQVVDLGRVLLKYHKKQADYRRRWVHCFPLHHIVFDPVSCRCELFCFF